MRTWVMRPLKVKALIERRHDAVQVIVQKIISKGNLSELQRPLTSIPRIEVDALNKHNLVPSCRLS